MSQLWVLWLLLLVSWNIKYGPRQEEARRSQMRSALGLVYQGRTPETTPLFMALAPYMIQELGACDIVRFDRQENLEAELWSFLRDRSRSTVGSRWVAMNRYGGSLSAAHLWERSCVAFDADMMKDTTRMARVSAASALAADKDSGAPTTLARRPCGSAKAMQYASL